MSDLMQCRRCGSYNDVGVCWSYSHDYPEPSGHEHDMRPVMLERPVMTLEEVIELSQLDMQASDDLWESGEDDE